MMQEIQIPQISDSTISSLISKIITINNTKIEKPIRQSSIEYYVSILSKELVDDIISIKDNLEKDEYITTTNVSILYDTIKANESVMDRLYSQVDKVWQKPNIRDYIVFIKSLINGKMLYTIKALRQCWPLGLIESKEIADRLYEVQVNDYKFEANHIVKKSVMQEAIKILDNLKEDYPEYFV